MDRVISKDSGSHTWFLSFSVMVFLSNIVEASPVKFSCHWHPKVSGQKKMRKKLKVIFYCTCLNALTDALQHLCQTPMIRISHFKREKLATKYIFPYSLYWGLFDLPDLPVFSSASHYEGIHHPSSEHCPDHLLQLGWSLTKKNSATSNSASCLGYCL